MILRRWRIRAARKAIIRHYGVPYVMELSAREYRGMVLLEERGFVRRDSGPRFTGTHWHLTEEKGRNWIGDG